VPIVDTHCHVSPVYYEPVEVLLFQMDRAGVDQAVLIQMREEYDNAYQFECVRRYPGRFASVVLVDHTQPDAPSQLARLAEQGAVGVRFRADVRSPGDDSLAIWREAERLGLAVSCQGGGGALASPRFAELVAAVPRLPIVLEHMAGQHGLSRGSQAAERSGGRQVDTDGLQAVLSLARFPNVYVKITGLGEFSERAMPVTHPFPFVRPIPPLLDQFCDAFGADRLMWGSDYPPVSIREGYANALRLPMQELAGRSDEDRAKIFGETALKVFPIRR
jgi:L-fuconolactonase